MSVYKSLVVVSLRVRRTNCSHLPSAACPIKAWYQRRHKTMVRNGNILFRISVYSEGIGHIHFLNRGFGQHTNFHDIQNPVYWLLFLFNLSIFKAPTSTSLSAGSVSLISSKLLSNITWRRSFLGCNSNIVSNSFVYYFLKLINSSY